ncbi:hypothetical protein PNA2_0943 [Pyrococcus sp. NA2]|uniref:transglutaminase-like domain-containing protein n=1 Tax=Pyrococcus sp. (strain NA2) TaxID=342949 RepID=UPI000209A916|nr:transglutaminase domain-containing protein [Pyrococcus sp. NA2]AEC51859.1 hypothetical protein PNA2_0943 [Pyrococcus sp. NA2]
MRKITSTLILALVGFLLISSSYQQTISFRPLPKVVESGNELDVSRNIYYTYLKSNVPIMRVTQKVGIVEYLRQNVYVTYENGVWRAKRVNVGNISVEEPSLPHKVLRDLVKVELNPPLIKGNLFTALHTVSLSIPSDYYPEYELFKPKEYPVASYSFEVVKYVIPEDILRKLPTDDSLKDYLQVPKLSRRVYELAFNITRNAKTPYEKALAIKEFLVNNYIYDENPIPPVPGIDPVEWFLFYTKRGVCLDFNTAFVILARIVGIPARLVTGYRIEKMPGTQVVRTRQAHAWAEIYLKGAGWITVDATGYRREERPREVANLRANITVLPNGSVIVTFSRNVNGSVEVSTYSTKLSLNVSGKSLILPLNITGPDKITVRVGNLIFEKIITGPPKAIVTPSEITIAKGENGSVKIITFQNKISIDSPLPYELVRDSNGFKLILKGEKVGRYKIGVEVGGEPHVVLLNVGLKTRVKIVRWPNLVWEDKEFYVEGTLMTEDGRPVPRGVIIIEARKNKDGNGVVIGKGEVREGRFRIKCKIGEVGDYHIVAIYQGHFPFLPSTSDPKIRVISSSKIIAETFNVTSVGVISIRGALLKENDEPIPGESVKIQLDGRDMGFLRTGSGGTFLGVIKISTPGWHTIKITYPGNEFLEPSSLEWHFLALKLLLKYDDIVEGGEPIKITGEVQGIRNGIIMIKSELGSLSVKVRDGKFQAKIPTRSDTEGVYKITFLYEDTVIREISVIVRPKIDVMVQGKLLLANKSDLVKIKVLYGDKPLQNATVYLRIGNVSMLNITDERGIAKFNVLLERPGRYHAEALIIMGNGFVSYPFSVRVIRFPLYIYAVISILLLSLLYIASRFILPRLNIRVELNRFPPVYVEGEEILIRLSMKGTLLINNRPVGYGKVFKLKLTPGIYRVSARKWFIKGEEKIITVVETLEEAIIRAFNERFGDEPAKTPREIAGKSIVTEIFERVRYGLSRISKDEFVTFWRGLNER